MITTPGRLARLAPVARTVTWPALLAGATACLAVVLLASLGDSAHAHWPGLGALALCTGAAFLLDDPAAATVAATPRSLARRRMLRVAVALPLLCVVWSGMLWYATAAHDAWFGPDTRVALSVQFAAMLTLTLAASATALRLRPDEQGGWTGVVVLFALLGVVYVLPQRWTLFAAGGDGTWADVQQRWAALLALGVCALVWANRDPAARRGARSGRAWAIAGPHGSMTRRGDLVTIARTPSLRRLLPAVLSLALAGALCAFFLMELNAFSDHFYSVELQRFMAASFPRDGLTLSRTIQAGVAGFIVTTVLLFGPLLYFVRRWDLPPGASLAVIGTHTVAIAALASFQYPEVVALGLTGAGVVEALARVLRPSPARLVALRAFCVAAPTCFWAVYLGGVAIVDGGLGWSAEVGGGAVAWSALALLGV